MNTHRIRINWGQPAEPPQHEAPSKGYARQFLTLDEAMRIIRARWTGEPHIIFDPNVDYQYRIIRRQTSDGTLDHYHWLLHEALESLFGRSSYYKPMGDLPPGHLPFYTVGRIRFASVFGKVKLGCSETRMYPGERQSVIIPVRCEYRPVASEVLTA